MGTDAGASHTRVMNAVHGYIRKDTVVSIKEGLNAELTHPVVDEGLLAGLGRPDWFNLWQFWQNGNTEPTDLAVNVATASAFDRAGECRF
jgi:hypothetical protein